jgi:saccharopine dehydrogenase-like NADP-dependent oxidoreductase
MPTEGLSFMRVFGLGCAGRISREAILDMLRFGDEIERITIADADARAAEEVVQWLADDRVDALTVDVNDMSASAKAMRGYDLVVDGTPISMNDQSSAVICQAGLSGINLNGMSREWDLDERFRAVGKILVPGFGMTPGITNIMAMHMARRLDRVESVRCSHGAFRPIAFSVAIAETTRVEYDPNLPSRVVFEEGEFLQVPPFARPMDIELPQPYGTLPQYIIPHPEPLTLSKSLADTGVRLVEARGTWPPKNMRLIRAMHEWGILTNPTVRLRDVEIGVLDTIFAHCLSSEEGTTTELYGYALHVEVIGTKDGQRQRHVMTHTHPASDGSVPEWAGLRAYTRNVGIPLAIGALMILRGQAHGVGAVAPELAFEPEAIFDELAKRDMHVQHQVT